MRDKYLCEEGIKEKYENRFLIINTIKYAGTLGGGTFALMGVGKENVGEVLITGGISVVSYLLGDYIYKKNELKRKEALKGVEKKLLSEGRR